MNIAFNRFNEIKSGNRTKAYTPSTATRTQEKKKTEIDDVRRFFPVAPLHLTLFSASHPFVVVHLFFHYIFSFALHLPCFSFSRENLNVNKIMNVYSNSIVWLLSCYYFNLEYGYGVWNERVYVLFTTPAKRSLYQTECVCVCVVCCVPGYLTSPISVDRETDDGTVRVCV